MTRFGTLTNGSETGTESVSARLHDERFAAGYVGLSLSTLRRMRRKRLGGCAGPEAGPAFVYIMSAVRYDAADLDRWIEALPRAGGGVAA
jgi:hypothetical protein